MQCDHTASVGKLGEGLEMRLHLEIVCLVEFSSLNQKRSQLETVSQISSQSEVAVVAHLGHGATSDFSQSCTSACCSYSLIKSKYVVFVYFLIFSVNIQYGVYAPSQHELPLRAAV